jgi:superkiller protein 3
MFQKSLLRIIPLITIIIFIQSCSPAITDEERVLQRVLSAGEYNDLGVVYQSEALYDEAVTAFLRAIEVENDYIVAWTNLGNTYNLLEDYAKAITAYQHALELDPTSIEAKNNLAWTYIRQQEELETAIELVKECAEEASVYQQYCCHTLGMAYYHSGRNVQAIEQIKTAISLSPSDSTELLGELYFDLGVVYLREGNHELAKAKFQQSVTIAPGSQWAERSQQEIDSLERSEK